MVIGLRAYAGNPWVLERLALLAGHYRPAPAFVIVDFGSAEPYASEIARVCREGGMTCVRVEDDGVFSAASARNAGAQAARTELLFFNDIDCFGERDLIARIASHANAIDLGACFDQLIVLPVVFVARETTARVIEKSEPEERAALLRRARIDSLYSRRSNVTDFVDPFSNFFVCHRDFFELTGGFNGRFRGHGSEDYEFFVRQAVIAGQLPLPQGAGRDLYGPRSTRFFASKAYRGFRRLGELAAFHAEASGLWIAHLDHPRNKGADDWYTYKDKRRGRFRTHTAYLRDPRALLTLDFLPRARRVAVLAKHREDVPLFLPLRWRGFELCAPDEARVDAVAYLGRDEASKEVVAALARAEREQLEVIRIAPGPLPGSIRYGAEISPDRWERVEILTAEERAVVAAVRDRQSVTSDEQILGWLLFRYLSFALPGGAVYHQPGKSHLRAKQFRPFSPASYAAGRIGTGSLVSATLRGQGKQFLLDSPNHLLRAIGERLFRPGRTD